MFKYYVGTKYNKAGSKKILQITNDVDCLDCETVDLLPEIKTRYKIELKDVRQLAIDNKCKAIEINTNDVYKFANIRY